MTIWEAIAAKTILMVLLDDGVFEPEIWERDIESMKQSGFESMAADLEKRKEHYQKEWTN